MFYWWFYGIDPFGTFSWNSILPSSPDITRSVLEQWINAFRGLLNNGGLDWEMVSYNIAGGAVKIDPFVWLCALVFSGFVIFFVLRLVILLFSLVFGRRAR